MITNGATVYAWSDNDAAVRVFGGFQTNIVYGYEAGSPLTTNVYMKVVTIAAGASMAQLPIFGVEEKGTANIVLSSWPGYRFDSTKTRLVDYKTVPVKCIAPLPASIVAKGDHTTITADSDYYTSKTRVSIYLTQAVTNDIAVTLKTTFSDDATVSNWYDYVRYSTMDSVTTFEGMTTEPTFTLHKDSTEPYNLYIYALRSDDHTRGTGHQVILTPYVDGVAMTNAGIVSAVSHGMNISAAIPEITTPSSNATYEVTAGNPLEILTVVSDIYADETDTNTGYKVEFKPNSTIGWQDLGKFLLHGEDGLLDVSNMPPVVSYGSAGTFTSYIRVTAPISKRRSVEVPLTVTVNPAKSTTSGVWNNETGAYETGTHECMERDIVKFQVGLSAQNDTDQILYAFLVSNDAIDPAMFGGKGAKAIVTNETVAMTAATSQGIQISKVGQYVTSSMTVLDGASEDDGGTSYSFSIALCTTPYYDPNARLPGYDTTDYLSLLVYNVEPTFTDVRLEGFEAESTGYTFTQKYPQGQTLEIQPTFDDATYDLLHGFEYRWTAGSRQRHGPLVLRRHRGDDDHQLQRQELPDAGAGGRVDDDQRLPVPVPLSEVRPLDRQDPDEGQGHDDEVLGRDVLDQLRDDLESAGRHRAAALLH